MRSTGFGVYQAVMGVVYLGLMTNLLLLLTCSPLVLLLLVTDPAGSWPLLALTAPVCGPALAAAFHTFAAQRAGSPDVVRSFVAGYRRSWRRALAVGALATAVLVVVAVDVRFFSDSPAAVAVVPLLGVVAVLAVAVALVALTALPEAPAAPLRTVLAASAVLAVRRWYLTAASLVVLAGLVVLLSLFPAIALGLAAAPALYLAWANSRHSLLPVLGDTATATP